jgi:uncharacterized protein DUF6624
MNPEGPGSSVRVSGMPIDEELRRVLLAMREEDLRVREQLLPELGDGYHPRMEEVHRRNTDLLKQIIAACGWPGRSLAGVDGAMAAWFVAQHAISDPEFQRRALVLLRDAVAMGEASPAAAAYLEDRIAMYEGRPQVYGTQFEPDENGITRPYWIAEPEQVNQRRAAIGLDSIEERTRKMRAEDEAQPPRTPEQIAAWRREYEEWLRKTGWRT